MGGGLMQLVAYGAQDIYLTGNPQITFFKVVYRRHTNFSMESIQQTWNGTSDNSNNDARCTATISRNGDLIHKMYIVLGAGASGTSVVNSGSDWIKTCELEIGGQQIDKITGQWMEVWAELSQNNPSGQIKVAKNQGTVFQNMSGFGGVDADYLNGETYVPLPFWFCRNPGLALPLIALQYHEVKIVLEHNLKRTFSDDITTQHLWVDYIYLDTDERRRFAQVSHEYLIEQLQYQNWDSATNSTQRLNFNHPVKELIWCNASATNSTPHQSKLRSLKGLGNTKYQLKLNGHDRFAARNVEYFTRQQVYDYHTGSGGLDPTKSSADDANVLNDSIAVYSFALKPEEHQPSGTCNFSRIDNAQLTTLDSAPGSSAKITIYAVNYNVLRIMSGMGGLAYSN